jgi:ATP-dependent Clp endopeptidase proteolytic subunit ClpP
MKNTWYNIQSQASTDFVDVYLFDEIGLYGVTAQGFINDIKDYKNQPINLHINCVGGDVFEGMAIYNVLKKRTQKTTVYIEGIAASMGSIIALAGDEVIMSENSLYMIHNAWGGTMGEANEMRRYADILEKLSNESADIYVKKTGLSLEEVKEMMDEETWLNAEEALEFGFIDTISDAVKVAAKIDVSKFKNITSDKVKQTLNTNLKKSKMTEDLKNWFSGKIEEVIAKVKGDDETVETAESTGNVEVEVKIADNEEVAERLSEFEASIESLNSTIVSLEEEISSTKGENETLNTEVLNLQAKLNKSEAVGTKVDTDGEPSVVKETVMEDANAGFYNVIANEIRRKFNN